MPEGPGAPRKYDPKTLEKKVNKYFKSISREVEVKEKVDSGERDAEGHVIYDFVPMINQLGKPVTVTEYIVPPSIADLALYLGIHRSTWTNYCKDPEYFDTTTRARGRIFAYLNRELLTRSGKDIAGIKFDLEVNHKCRETTEIELGPEAKKLVAASSLPLDEREQLLREIASAFQAEEGGGDEPGRE